ncbi:hypothetical protein GCM10009657_25980 [Oryzihumus leptocrescens]
MAGKRTRGSAPARGTGASISVPGRAWRAAAVVVVVALVGLGTEVMVVVVGVGAAVDEEVEPSAAGAAAGPQAASASTLPTAARAAGARWSRARMRCPSVGCRWSPGDGQCAPFGACVPNQPTRGIRSTAGACGSAVTVTGCTAYAFL